VIKNHLETPIVDPFTRIETMEMLPLCLDQNYFIFEGHY
jgi:hypothetical protein